MADKKVLDIHVAELDAPATTQPVRFDDITRTDLSTPANPRSFLWSFARSICNANKMATSHEREGCEDGVPCDKLQNCTGQADKAIRYIEDRKTGLKR